jgi:hypothetical protein
MAHEDAPGIGQMWRQQPQAEHRMSMEEIRTKAKDLDAKVKQWNQVGGLMVALLLVKNAWEIWVDTDLLERGGDTLMFLALVYVIYQFVRYARAETSPAARGQASCSEYYRARLVRQRDLSSEGWKYILPFVPGVALIVFGRAMQGRPAGQVALLIVLALLLFAAVLWVIARRTRTLEQEIAALDQR